MKTSVKRPRNYKSAVRSEQARRTRERIVAAARERFIAVGYAPTSLASIAALAGVAAETVYDSFGNKRQLLEAVVEATIVGATDESADITERGWVQELLGLPDLAARIDGFARHTAQTVARMAPIHALIRTAAAADAGLSELAVSVQANRFANQRRVLAALLGLDATATRVAAETFSALASPELHHVLVSVQGWSQTRYTAWLRRTVGLTVAVPQAGRLG